MSDDGTGAVKKIAYCIQLDSTLAQARHLLQQMEQYFWTEGQEACLKSISIALTPLSTDDLINSFYKVIGEAE